MNSTSTRRLGRQLAAAVAVPAMIATTTSGSAWAVRPGAPVGEGIEHGTVQLVSLANDDEQGRLNSRLDGVNPVVSSGGRYVVFSTDNALVARDRNETTDVYRRDTMLGRTELVSVARDGGQGDDYSFAPSISSGGRFVAFITWSDALVPGDTGGTLHVMVKDMKTGRLEHVSRTSRGELLKGNNVGAVISPRGQHVAIQTFAQFGAKDDDRREDVYVYDRSTDRMQQVSLDRRGRDIEGSVLVGTISANGRFVTFGNDNDSWVHDRTERITSTTWREGNWGTDEIPGGSLGRPVISGNGRYVVFQSVSEVPARGETDWIIDLYRLDRTTGKFDLVTVAADGTETNAHSFGPSVSHSGRFVGFTSRADNLVVGDDNGEADTFVRDMVTGQVRMTSWGVNGPGDEESGAANALAISPDGRHMAFESYAQNLVAEDTNRRTDVFLWTAPQ